MRASATMDLLLDLLPDQMMLQIHESIGHPLELDRILGDERNFAGTSFVTLDMFGRYRYGSELLNVTFDPTRAEQFASYGFDDEGTPAQREYLIARRHARSGRSAARCRRRAGMAGVANARAEQLEPPADRPHGQPQRRAGRRPRSTTWSPGRAGRADAHQRRRGRSTTRATSSSSAASRAR
jgi:predicted Zn-dependent protease